jgi:TetR/AcrR family transcriptional regulator
MTAPPTPPVQHSKRTRNAARTREAILDAAEQLFADNGYESTSLQAVGEAAGLSRGTPGYFFGSKEGLYQAVLDRSFARVEQTLRETYEAAEGANAEELMHRVLRAYLRFPPTFVRLVEREALRGGGALQNLQPRLSQLRSTLSRLAALTDSQLKPVPPAFLLISIVALAWFPIAHANTMLRTLELDIADETFLTRYEDFVAELLVRGVARPESD